MSEDEYPYRAVRRARVAGSDGTVHCMIAVMSGQEVGREVIVRNDCTDAVGVCVELCVRDVVGRPLAMSAHLSIEEARYICDALTDATYPPADPPPAVRGWRRWLPWVTHG